MIFSQCVGRSLESCKEDGMLRGGKSEEFGMGVWEGAEGREAEAAPLTASGEGARELRALLVALLVGFPWTPR